MIVTTTDTAIGSIHLLMLVTSPGTSRKTEFASHLGYPHTEIELERSGEATQSSRDELLQGCQKAKQAKNVGQATNELLVGREPHPCGSEAA